MKISYKEPDHKVNQGPGEGLLSILVNVALIAIAVLVLAVAVRMVIGYAAPLMPFSLELKLRGLFSSFLEGNLMGEDQQVAEYLAGIVDTAAKDSPVELPTIQPAVVCLDLENAFALPGAEIMITSRLIENLESEQELFMVLSHELGHVVHRHNMELLGNAFFELGLMLFGATFLNDGADSLVDMVNLLSSMSYSRAQEIEADHFGVVALERVYSEVSGAHRLFELFKRIEERELGGKVKFLQSLTATHPHSEQRSKLIHTQAQRNGWKESGAEKTPIAWLQDAVKKGCEGREGKANLLE